MKKFLCIGFLAVVILFSGCSGKYQTNKLPDEKSVYVPEGYEKSKYYLYEKPREEYKKYVIEEFNHGFDERVLLDDKKKHRKTKENKSSVTRNDLWNKGYDLDRKRY